MRACFAIAYTFCPYMITDNVFVLNIYARLSFYNCGEKKKFK